MYSSSTRTSLEIIASQMSNLAPGSIRDEMRRLNSCLLLLLLVVVVVFGISRFESYRTESTCWWIMVAAWRRDQWER